MNYIEKYQIKRDFEQGIIKEENLPEEIKEELREMYLKEASNYYYEYLDLKKQTAC